MKDKRNIIMIGMPASGKSTVGVILAKELKYGFTDTDLIMQENTDQTLVEIMEERGIEGFLALENRLLSELRTRRQVIATGGSAVYGAEAMKNLMSQGVTVYLRNSYETIDKRLNNIKTRGVTLKKGQTLRELYEERMPLYEKYARITVDGDDLNVEETVQQIMEKLKAEGEL